MFTRTLFFLCLIATATTTGCANLERNLQDPAVWQRISQINDHYAERREQIRTGVYGGEHEVIDLTGDWSFRHGGQNRANRIRHGGSGIMVMPVNSKNRPVYYAEIGTNLYQSKEGATYKFDTIHTGQWRSNDRRNTVINLRRTSWQ